jgi:tRNA pseudouridine55 synthase
MHNGLLCLNKPIGDSSRQVVNRVQRLTKPAKCGHAGTLDPLATGVLVVCVGQATKLIEYVQRMPKRYLGTFLLGRESPTEDIEGEVRELIDPPVPTLSQIQAAAARLTGEIMQRPPAYSALKLGGRRAYDLARAGKEVELAPRPILIHDITVVSYHYPELALDIACGSGTYVRSLGRDLAESLGTAAVMSALVRTEIGEFRLSNALDAQSLTAENLPGALMPASIAVVELPAWQLTDEELRRISHGLTIRRDEQPPCSEIAAFDAANQLAAVLAHRPDGSWTSVKNFVGAG